jgi:iron complex outermembrane recepter protein
MHNGKYAFSNHQGVGRGAGRKLGVWGIGGAALFTLINAASAQTSQTSTGSAPLEEVIVTGVFYRSGLDESPISITAIDAEALREQIPNSAADLLKNVPGVFVNSSLGEIRNVVYSRGVSASSLDGASGYYYVSLQEDGLPVLNAAFNNFGPDYFYRPDLTLNRLEALRGGTASITGPNAPGGIFNYISRTGDEPAAEVQARYGLEGNGHNPFYRADLFMAGPIGDSDFKYSVGGFYRDATGARDPGYSLNRGGQIKANLQYTYDAGTLTVYAKYLNDHNGWFEFLPAKNFDDPKIVSPVSRYDSVLPPKAVHRFTQDAGDSFRSWDASTLVHAKSTSVGFKVEHRFGEGWSLDNNLKYVDNKLNWNSGAVIFPVAIDDFFNYILLGTYGPGGAGTYTFRDASGAARAVVQSPDGFNFTTVANSLPNQTVQANGVLTQAALARYPEAKEWMEQISVSKSLENMRWTVGAFYAHSDVSIIDGGGGLGISPIDNRPQLFDIKLVRPDGVVQQVSSPEGFAGIGNINAGNYGKAVQKQASVFLGHNWDLTDRLLLDWGVRYEDIGVEGTNQVPVALTGSPGGLDGNPNTLYDNILGRFGAPVTYDDQLDFVSFSGALSYRFTDEHNAYARYSEGKKAPDLAFFLTRTTQERIDTSPPVAQEVQQIEIGYRFIGEAVQLSISPFYSKLSKVGDAQPLTDIDGSIYVPPTLYATLDTIGVEIEGHFNIRSQLQLHTSITVQDPKSQDYRVWIANTPGPADDTISSVPDGDADNNPKLMATTTLNYSFSEQFPVFLTWKYMGRRAANRYNTFYLPAFNQLDAGMSWKTTSSLSLAFNENNLLNG